MAISFLFIWTHLMHDSFSKKMQTWNMDLKVIWRLKKVKESDLKIVKGELKQFFSNFYFQIINRWKKMTEDGLAWQYRRVTRGGRGREVSPALFHKLEKSALICGKKCPDCCHQWVKFSFKMQFSSKMQFLRVSRRKKRRFFTGGAFLSCVLGECLSKCPISKKTPLP